MSGLVGWTTLAALLMASHALASDPPRSIADLPVADAKSLAPAEFGTAAQLARRGGTPVEIALAIAGAFEGSVQHVVQVNEGSESPSASRVTVVRDGLLDDSVRGERWDIGLARSADRTWTIKEVKRSWRCRRGPQTDRFLAVPCP
jgi:hypothetical protein